MSPARCGPDPRRAQSDRGRGAARPRARRPTRHDERDRHQRHRRVHGRRQREQNDHGQDDLHDLPGEALPGDGPQPAADVAHVAPVADPAMDVAHDPAGQRDVEELRAVVRRDRGGQRQVDAETAGHDLPAPGAAHRGQQRRCAAAAASARASTVRTPSTNGPVPRRQTRMAKHHARWPERRGPTLHSGSGSSRHPLRVEDAAAGPGRDQVRCRWNGPSRRPTRRAVANAIVSGSTRASETRKAGTPGREPAGHEQLVDDRRRSGRASGTGCRTTSRGCASAASRAARRSAAGRPVASAARRHAMAGPSARSTQNRRGRASTPSPATRSSRAPAPRRRAPARPTATTCGPRSRRRCRRSGCRSRTARRGQARTGSRTCPGGRRAGRRSPPPPRRA